MSLKAIEVEVSDATAEEAPSAIEVTPPSTLKVTELEVAGMCCQSEVTLIEKKIGTMKGVHNLKVNLLLRRVAVTHDEEVASVNAMLRVLNWALLGASVVQKGGTVGLKHGRLCTPAAGLASACVVLFGVAGGIWARSEDTGWHEDPYSYFALACVALGAPVLLARAISGLLVQRTLNMFATQSIAVAGALALLDLWEAAAIVTFFAASEWVQVWCVHHTADKVCAAVHPSSLCVLPPPPSPSPPSPSSSTTVLRHHPPPHWPRHRPSTAPPPPLHRPCTTGECTGWHVAGDSLACGRERRQAAGRGGARRVVAGEAGRECAR
jgi:copper chaperone CopZ